MDRTIEFEVDFRCWVFGFIWDDIHAAIVLGPLMIGISKNA